MDYISRKGNESSYEFIELHRTFHDLPKDAQEDDELDILRELGIGAPLGWTALIKEYRLVILSEAGSGKTTEIHNIARTLREQNKQAFFLRLEHIPGDFEDAFEVGTYEEFGEWLNSEEEGWLLLDSVDEARLRHPKDFELAIRKLGRRIQTAQDRSHIVITGRITAWRPKSDLDYCKIQLPYHGARSEAEPVFKIVTLDDLTSDQVAIFASSRGVDDNQTFLDDVERANAWSFTSRPQDLEELIGFWIKNNRIGTGVEIMRNSIERRLAERDQDRAETNSLSSDRVRDGVRLLAATATLTREQTIRVPDGANNSGGIAVQSVLDDWDDGDQATLLSRPIFDEAIYSTVRFHHRSVREFLTAEWFAELLSRETSRRDIEGLFFRYQYGLQVVAPCLRPILPWLALFDEKIRERVNKVAPEIFFEGGDPSQLPLELRRRILRHVCEQIASGATGRSMHDRSAVQRFANPDLTGDIRELLGKYRDNDDLTAFLFRMVWTGRLDGVKREVMDVALTPTAERYTRSVAFRAINTIGSETDKEHIRQSFLEEAPEIRRIWLAEIADGVIPTEETVSWLLACLEKCKTPEPHSIDHCIGTISKFVDSSRLELLPKFITGINRLLNLPPVFERRYCEVSQKFGWLLASASKAVEKLVLARHPASFEQDSLNILHKLAVARDYMTYEATDFKAEFSKLVPEWAELNRALFWFGVERAREAVKKDKDERLTDHWQVTIFERFWRFEVGDFEYVVKEISHRDFIDDRLIALSLAFDLYRAAGRPRPWREKLKKSAANNAELSARLAIYLRPPAQDAETRRRKQRQAKWKKRDEEKRKKQEQRHADWKKWFNENLADTQQKLRKTPGVLTDPVFYLYERIWNKQTSSGGWTGHSWKILIPEYGEDVARFYRDSAISFWRHYKPPLQSEGTASSAITGDAVIGLTGLEIESREVKDWTDTLSSAEVQLACRYAFIGWNGFPTWLPELFETHTEIVGEHLMQEVRYELSIEKPEQDTCHVLNTLSWSGQWAWDKLASGVYTLLKSEPQNLSNLDRLLKIVDGSDLPGELIEKLAFEKCRTLSQTDHLARWFAAWAGVSPETAIEALKRRISKIDDPQAQTSLAMVFVTHLLGDRRGEGAVSRQAFKTPEHLKSLYILMREYIRPDEDIDRSGTGVYSPGLRDEAQDARNKLFDFLLQIPGKETFSVLRDLAETHPVAESRPVMKLYAKSRAEQDSDIQPWLPEQVKEFHEKIERTPCNHRELADLAVSRLLDLKDDLEHGDNSIAGILQKGKRETDIRNYITHELREKAFGRYSIPQEEELADARKPDLRFHGEGFDGPVPVELKLADNWSGPGLCERMQNQLCGDYLRDNHSNRGIFLLVYRGDKPNWELPNGSRVNFSGLTQALQELWPQISPKFPKVEDVTGIGIDLTCRSGA